MGRRHLDQRSVRIVERLPDGGRRAVDADLIRNYPYDRLDDVENAWQPHRLIAAEGASTAGHDLEHSHWDWRRKSMQDYSLYHEILAVVSGDEVQGLMSIETESRPGRIAPAQGILYLDFLEVAPWNLKHYSLRPRFSVVGSRLLAETILISREMGLGGRVGLHSLPQAEGFYADCMMQDFGLDRTYLRLHYFEYTEEAADAWITTLGA